MSDDADKTYLEESKICHDTLFKDTLATIKILILNKKRMLGKYL